jgi:hypothetical protein
VPPYSVRGYVRDSTGSGIPGVEIVGGGTNATDTTDTLGHFSISLHDSPDIVEARKPGWTFTDSASGDTFAGVINTREARVVRVTFKGVPTPDSTR